MDQEKLSRRDFLRGAAVASAGGLLAACTPAPAEPEVVIQTQVVKETVVVEGEAVEVTKIVEKEVEVTGVPTPEEIILNMAQGSFWEPRFAPAIERFLDKYPQVQGVNFISMSGMDHEEVYAKILSLFAAGESIDTIGVNDAGLRVFWGKEMAHPLDEYVKGDAPELKEYFSDVHPILTESALYEGSIWMLPWRWNGANMFLNMNMFEEAGIEFPADDWTKDDFYEIAKALSKGEGGDRQYGYSWVIRTWGGWLCWSFVNAEPWAAKYLEIERQPGGEWFWDEFYADDPQAEGRGGGFFWGQPTANSEVNVEALEFQVQMHQEGISPSIDVGGGATLQGFFTTDKLAMSPGGGFWAGGLVGAGMEPYSFDVANFPAWKSQAQLIGTAGDMMVSYCRHKDEAWGYIKELSSLENHAMIAEGNITTVVRRSFHNAEQYAPTGPEHWNVFYDCLDLPGTSPYPSPPENQELTPIFIKYTSLAMSLDMTAKEACDAMQAELEELWARTREEA